MHPDSTPPAPTTRPPDSRTRILTAALGVLREKGYTATTVDDLCRAAGVTKGSFFHHFESKEAAVLAAIGHWNETTGALFAQAPYWQVADPRARLLAYLDFRAQLVRGALPEFTCLLGTLAQETFASHPALQAACGAGIDAHAMTLVPIIEAARLQHAPDADWRAESLAHHTQTVLQGGFVLAKALNDPAVALDAIAHLRRYIEQLLPHPTRSTSR
ncbi:TetR/AcrR family transcriptional regulator [Chitiniphilus purpureus]|uniref:TetR/AcrR family transcriptional regulator n=1 Tax=Chitiniphilus purpureus TaxID=2981137 RepID=A0ABY6DK04_9NEIS|nr:TetR/AcrR family transcriptional regulator [Chitiniphilus sp. CD1]UXY14699.1 TetR/AcrR family transcriptional regulator [Chitiniphilus sp. CD1]